MAINNINQLLEIYNVPEDKLDWNLISIEQKLSENFMENYKDKISFKLIPIYQKLSESFIENNKTKLNFYTINKYQNLSKQFEKDNKYLLLNADKIIETGTIKIDKISDLFLTYQILNNNTINIFKDDLTFSKNLNEFINANQNLENKIVTSADYIKINSFDFSCYIIFKFYTKGNKNFISIDLEENTDKSIIQPIKNIINNSISDNVESIKKSL